MLCACGQHRVCCWCAQQLPGCFSPSPENELPVVGYVLGSCRRFAYAVLCFWQWLARRSCGQRALSRQVHRCLLLCFERVMRFDQLFLCLGGTVCRMSGVCCTLHACCMRASPQGPSCCIVNALHLPWCVFCYHHTFWVPSVFRLLLVVLTGESFTHAPTHNHNCCICSYMLPFHDGFTTSSF